MQRSPSFLAAATAIVLAATAGTARAQAADPVLGTWVLDVAKSTYGIAPGPKSATRTYTAAPKGFRFVADGVDAAGKKTHAEFTVAYDGKYHPTMGVPNADSIMVRRIDARTVEAVQKMGMKEVSRTIRAVSADGKTLTATMKGTRPDGKPGTNVEVYRRR